MLNPGSGAPGTTTPTRKEPKPKPEIDTRRKQTLLSLLDILAELQKEGDSSLVDAAYQSKVEKLEEPTEGADEQLQKVGAEAFFKFQKRINNLDRELRNFANATRQLGSSVGILSSAFHLRERIVQILFLFRENAANLFRRVPRQTADQLLDQRHRTEESSMSTGHRKPLKRLPHVARPSLPKDRVLDVEDFPEQLEEFARDIKTFLKSLNEFPEFTDEAVNNSMNAFEADLKYWASCLKTYEGQFRYPAVQRYVHDLCGEMGDHLDTITSSLQMFLEIGIPTIRFAQQHAADNLLNLSTVATFFSAVTATTLQFSFDTVGNPTADAVNSFWFISLVFSIASAVNSLLGVTWKQAIYRSPGHRVPWWVLIWIKRSPLIFLVFSVAAFSVGLCLFAYSSNQNPVTSALTTVFTCFSSFGLIAVSAWFIFERWTFSRHLGKKWLMDVLSEKRQKMRRRRTIRWLFIIPYKYSKRAWKSANQCLSNLGDTCTKLGRDCVARMGSWRKEGTEVGDAERGHEKTASPAGLSTEMLSVTASPTGKLSSEAGTERFASPTPSSPLSPASPETASASAAVTAHPASTSVASLSLAASETIAATECNQPASPGASGSGAAGPAGPSTSGSSTGAGRRRFANVVRSVISARKALGPNSPITPLATSRTTQSRKQRVKSYAAIPTGLSEQDEYVHPSSSRGVARVASLIPTLKSLHPSQLFQPHTALVRHLQFSPNGEFLATCSWDRTCLIFKVKDFTQPHRILAHPQGFVGQVAWSPNGDLLLTKMIRGVKLWTTDSGVCRKTITRNRSIQSIAWFPQGEAFLSVEESEVMKLDLNGKILDTYSFERMLLHDVAITNDQQRMLCVATLTSSPDGLKPSMSREEKQIIVYNLDRKEIENQVPILHEVRDITLARNGSVALVSYENKAPPQLWKLETVRDRTNETTNSIVRLSLVHTYMPKSPVDFAGPSYFGGNDDQLVLCAGKAGDIHIWDRRTSYMLHSFQAQDIDNDLTCIAWNHAVSSPFMFATGSHDGTVRLWTSTPQFQLPQRSSYIDLRCSENSTPRTVTPDPPSMMLHPTFALEITERLESSTFSSADTQQQRASRSRDGEGLSVDSLASSRRNSSDSRGPLEAGTSTHTHTKK
ncbi:hypothetical protein ACEPAF_1294 [Sanghuangporus sanghuang]